MSEPFPKMRTVRYVNHPPDPRVHDQHAMGSLVPHSHILLEDSPHETKQRLGAHIDRWHAPVEKENADAP